MNRRWVIAVVLAATLAACSGSKSDKDAQPAGSTKPAAAEATTETSAAAAEPDESAADFLKRVIEAEAKGQLGRAYDMIHPAQQALFTRDNYANCTGAGDGADLTGFEEVETYTENVDIPGTDLVVPATAVTAKITLDVSGRKVSDTTTLHAISVDGQWAFVVDKNGVEKAVAGC